MIASEALATFFENTTASGVGRSDPAELPPESQSRLSTENPSAAQGRDAKLVRRVLEGDSRAARDVVALYAPLVRQCLGSSFSGADLEDHVQEVFARFFEYIARLRDPRALRSYFLGISLRVAAGERRRRRLRAREKLTPGGELPERAAPEVVVETEELIWRMRAVLARLRPDTARLLQLRYVEERELTAVALTVGVSLATVKRQLASASTTVRALAQREPAVAEYLRDSRA